jgi:hypothetical protein
MSVQTSIDALFCAGAVCTVHDTREKGVYMFAVNHPMHLPPDEDQPRMYAEFDFVPGNKIEFRTRLSEIAEEFGNQPFPTYNTHIRTISDWVFSDPVFSA